MPENRDQLAHRLLELTLDQVGTHALLLLDRDGIVVDYKAGAERVLGYKQEEIIGQNVSILFTPEDLQKDLSTWEQTTAAESGESENDRWQVRKDGGRIFVSGTLTALRDANGELLGFAKIMRNRTDQKLQVETLESRIDAQQQARQRKNNFISTLGHELRNPLNAISVAVQELDAYGPSTPETTFPLATIRRQVEFMSRMINDLMEVTRMAAGKIELHKQKLVLQEVIGQAVEACQPSIQQRAHELHQLLPDVPIALDADPMRLRQVFINLIENAAKYTPPGGTIWVKATTEGDEAVVRVQDTGMGVAPDIMPHIFDLFIQAEPARRTQSGLGIGLSVVKDTVTLHGGSVQVTSDGVGKGSEFTVRLPLMAEAPPHSA